jgi:hypothetical protein
MSAMVRKPLLKKDLSLELRPLKNAQFCSSSRKAKILTTGIHVVFRGLKFESDAEIEQKGAFCKGLRTIESEGRCVKRGVACVIKTDFVKK